MGLAARKMSYAQLAARFDLTDVRIEWLHDQFRECLDEGEVDNYPSDPAALSKEKMRELYADLKPDMTDEDGSGEIEFDEFIRWIFLEEIDLEGEEDEDE